ncbi:MAG TPA: transposase, partial [Arachidicoccus sp.]|nr:transposase [Arachidicoccus sp.]
ARKEGQSYVPEVFSNGETRKQLLARSRHLLYKSPHRWSEDQQKRASLLFEQYPDLKKAYQITNNLRQIYNQKITNL